MSVQCDATLLAVALCHVIILILCFSITVEDVGRYFVAHAAIIKLCYQDSVL